MVPSIPLGVVVVTGANVHYSRLVSATIDTDIISRPEVTPDSPQNLCLDKGYDYKRVEKELEPYFFTTFAVSVKKK
jgi:putative transposase